MSRPPEFVLDLRYASDHFSGIGTHAHGLAAALLDAPGGERWRVIWSPTLANSRFDLAPLRDHPRVDWVETAVPPMGWGTAHGTGALLRRLGGRAYLSPFWLMPSRPGLPVVLTLHDVLPLSLPGATPAFRRWVYGAAISRARDAAAVLASSEFTRDEIARHTRLPAARVRVLPIGVAPPPADPGTRPAGAPDGPFALVVGVNKPHKNLAVVARAYSRTPAPPLPLVGAGFVDARYPSLADLAAPGSPVTWLGRVAARELEWLYRNATLVLAPTRYEGFGLPLLEAAARGVPVVASDIPPLRETGEGVARFVSPDDPDAWAAAVRDLAGDPAERARMAAAGRERAARYDYATCAARTLAILREVAAG